MKGLLSSNKAPEPANVNQGFKVLGTRSSRAPREKSPEPIDLDDEGPIEGVPVLTKYEFNDVCIPADFLTKAPYDAEPMTIKQIDWTRSVLPGNGGAYAVVLDNVLSPSECDTMLRLAEESVPEEQRGKSGSQSWRPALVNVGGGYEVLQPDYRKSDRIIWDQQEVVDRLWERCAQAPGLREKLMVIENDPDILGARRSKAKTVDERWEFRRFNKRMRFLKYGPGQFFRAHCDGAYREPGTNIKTLFTVHLYLNDSKQAVGDEAELVGGATSFLSLDETRKMDVDPKAGRVLIFQHHGLYHSGDDVHKGLKYTMRTDIMYERIYKDD